MKREGEKEISNENLMEIVEKDEGNPGAISRPAHTRRFATFTG